MDITETVELLARGYTREQIAALTAARDQAARDQEKPARPRRARRDA